MAGGLTNSNKVFYEIVIQRYIKYKKQYEKDQKTIKSFNKLYRKPLQPNVNDRSEYGKLCNIFTKYVEENESESFF